MPEGTKAIAWTNDGLLSKGFCGVHLRAIWQLVRADSRFAPSQWETALLCNDVSHWLGANLESALLVLKVSVCKLSVDDTLLKISSYLPEANELNLSINESLQWISRTIDKACVVS